MDMKRKYLVWLGLLAGGLGAVIVGGRRLAPMLGKLTKGDTAPVAQQWPFDQNELRGLMDQALDTQRSIVAEATTPEDRARADAFGAYYQRRREAVGG